jgi:alginate O-acetyltransferase complex protein AlgI
MPFNSLTFLAFFAIVLLAHRCPISWTAKKTNLLVASYLFYAAWSPPFVLLLWISTLVDWIAARRIGTARTAGRKRAWVAVSLATNLGLLGYFKYGGFLLDNTAALLAAIGVPYAPPRPDIVLPVGISFYTFQTLSYTLDVYRGRVRPWPRFLDFALFVTFFPQLVAGPIVRAADFLPQCLRAQRASAAQLWWGVSLLIFGLFEKIVLADTLLAHSVDVVYGATDRAGFVDAWIATCAFSGQIFFDFAGYSTCAVGVALCLGFSLPDNFRAPYGAVGFRDFWQRWHISLSTWLRDYLYIPLGGNRASRARNAVNVAITMLLGGLWHGASWRFLAWGGLHAVYLIAERWLRGRFGGVRLFESRPAQLVLALVTYVLVCEAWVFFRAASFADAWRLLAAMHSGVASTLLESADVAAVVIVVVAMLVTHGVGRFRRLEDVVARMPVGVRALALALLVFLIAISPEDDRAFIYFQF